MPKILSYTPAWLSRPSTGFDLFTTPGKTPSSKNDSNSGKQFRNEGSVESQWLGAQRVIERRGTEILVAVGNTIRWADFNTLKRDWKGEEGKRHHNYKSNGLSSSTSESDKNVQEKGYRTLKTPTSEQIRQLILSPNGEFLAILTSHTAQIAILPHASYLRSDTQDPVRLKTYTLGAVSHVLSQSPIVTALWHPLGVDGSCLITVTAEAVVRMWELNRANRWSFDKPSLEFDLKKLQKAHSAEDDLSAATLGANRGYSGDGLDMEVAAATFGGVGSEGESGWCPMTLWVAMTEGDVYALCPLLPARWQPPSLLVPSLTTTVVTKASCAENESLDDEEKQPFDEQSQWLAEIDKQEPAVLRSTAGSIYDRPTNQAPIPRLQGPFRILPDDSDEEIEISGIHAIASKVDMEDLQGDDDDLADYYPADTGGLSASVICLLSRQGTVYICLDLDGIEASWLPLRTDKRKARVSTAAQPELSLFEALDTFRAGESSDSEWPTFTPDVCSPYSFFVAQSQGIFFFSLKDMIDRLEGELRSTTSEGAQFRMEVLTNSVGTFRERLLRIKAVEHPHCRDVAAAVVLQDPELGYMLFTRAQNQPHALLMDAPPTEDQLQTDRISESDDTGQLPLLILEPPRPAYQPSASFWQSPSFATFRDDHLSARARMTSNSEIRLSAETLDIMTDAHRSLSHDTHLLNMAAADLFRQCERLQQDFQDQIRRVDEVTSRIEALRDDEDTAEEGWGNARVEERLRVVRERQEGIRTRHEALRRKVDRAIGRVFSDKERAWMGEVGKLEGVVFERGKEEGGDGGKKDDDRDGERDGEGGGDGGDGNEAWQRFQTVRSLASTLVSQAQAVSSSDDSSTTTPAEPNPSSANGINIKNGGSSFVIPPDLRKVKVAQVMTLLERETALVDAAQERLGRLSLGTAAV